MLANSLTRWITRRPGATRVSLALLRRLGGDVASFGDRHFVLGHQAVVEILENHRDLTVAEANRRAFATGPVLLYTDDGAAYRNDKTVLRSVVDGAFMGRLGRTIDSLVSRHLEPYSRSLPPSHFDVVADYAEPIVAEVVGRHFIGDGYDQLPQLRADLRVLGTTLIDGEVSARTERAAASVIRLIEKRRSAPAADDLAAQLWQRSNPAVQSCPGSVAGLGLAATATVAYGFGQIVDQLIKRPEVLSVVTEALDDGDVLDRAIRECLRFNPVLVFVRRHAIRDVQLTDAAGGRLIPGGSQVMVGLSQAMFDARAFPAPYEFRLDRPLENYLHFGHSLHRCFGAPIAELLLRKMLIGVLSENLLERARTLEIKFDSWALASYVITRRGD